MNKEEIQNNTKTFTPFGKKAGMLVSRDDLNYNPLSICRAEPAWINSQGRIAVWDWHLGDNVLIPHKIFLDLCAKEKDKELGIDLLNNHLKENDLPKL